jgi:hypothetical protein
MAAPIALNAQARLALNKQFTATGSFGPYDTLMAPKLRVVIENVGGGSTVLVKGRLKNQTSYSTLATITGATSGTTVDTSVVDEVLFDCTVYSASGGTPAVIASTFFSVDSGGGSGDILDGGNATGSTVTIGTTDTQDLIFITDNVERLHIEADGKIGIGNTSPGFNQLSVYNSSDGSSSAGGVEVSHVVPTAGSSPNGYQHGIYVSVRADHDTGTLDLLRNYHTAEMSGDGTITEMYGDRAISRVYDFDAGGGDTSNATVAAAYGLEAYVGNVATGGAKIRNATGIYISRAQATGTDAGQTHTAIGLRIDSNITASGGDTNNAYAIKSETTAGSEFLGSITCAGLLPYDNYTNNIGSYSDPFGSVYSGDLRLRNNAFAFKIEPNSLSEDVTYRPPNTNAPAKGMAFTSTGPNNTEWNAISGVIGKLTSADFNSTADQSITINATKYVIRKILICNASTSLTTAAGGIYTATSKGGTALLPAATVYTALTTSTKFVEPSLHADTGTDTQTASTLYFSLTTAQGGAATADIFIIGDRLA